MPVCQLLTFSVTDIVFRSCVWWWLPWAGRRWPHRCRGRWTSCRCSPAAAAHSGSEIAASPSTEPPPHAAWRHRRRDAMLSGRQFHNHDDTYHIHPISLSIYLYLSYFYLSLSIYISILFLSLSLYLPIHPISLSLYLSYFSLSLSPPIYLSIVTTDFFFVYSMN